MSEVELLDLFQEALLLTAFPYFDFLAAGGELAGGLLFPRAETEESASRLSCFFEGEVDFGVFGRVVGHGEDAEDVGVGADGGGAVDLAADVEG